MMANERGLGRYVTDIGGLEREMRCKLELEHTVLEQRAQELRREARKQARQRAFLREERKKAREDKQSCAEDEAAFAHRSKEDWLPGEYVTKVSARADRLRLNVGGQIFEVGRKFLRQDPDSLLAALSDANCPLFEEDEDVEGRPRDKIAYVDRDWWIFRYVLLFLRDGVLPQSPQLTLSLYKEATFWRLVSLQRAIEEAHLNLERTTMQVVNDPDAADYGMLKESKDKKTTKFWLNKPNWWESQATKAPDEPAPAPADWWLDPKWHEPNEDWKFPTQPPGRAVLSTDPTKCFVTDSKDIKSGKDCKPMLSSTWGYR